LANENGKAPASLIRSDHLVRSGAVTSIPTELRITQPDVHDLPRRHAALTEVLDVVIVPLPLFDEHHPAPTVVDDWAMSVYVCRRRYTRRKDPRVPRIEYVTLANHAEALNGLLYLQGAGWTDMRPAQDDQGNLAIVHFGIGLSVLVGWNETNQRFPLLLELTHEDGGESLIRAEGQVEQGRPPGTTPGQDLRSVLAVNADVQFPRVGGYELRATMGEQVRSVSFRVHQMQAQAGPAGLVIPQPPA
jgi:hypothetical protein